MQNSLISQVILYININLLKLNKMLHSKQFVKYNQIGPLVDKQIFYTCYIFKYYYKYVYLLL